MSDVVQQYWSFYRKDYMCSLCKEASSPHNKQKRIRKKIFFPSENKILCRKRLKLSLHGKDMQETVELTCVPLKFICYNPNPQYFSVIFWREGLYRGD